MEFSNEIHHYADFTSRLITRNDDPNEIDSKLAQRRNVTVCANERLYILKLKCLHHNQIGETKPG